MICCYTSDDFALHTYSINGRLLARRECNERLYAFTWSEDGNFLVVGGERREVAVYDVHNLEPVGRYNGAFATHSVPPFPTPITSIHLTRRCSSPIPERHILVGTQGGQLYILALDAQYLRERLQEKLANLGF